MGPVWRSRKEADSLQEGENKEENSRIDCANCLDVKVELQLMEENIKAGKVTSSEVMQE